MALFEGYERKIDKINVVEATHMLILDFTHFIA